MNAKEEVILELNARIAYYENYKRRYLGDAAHAEKQINLFKSLITAVEVAIFDVPSEEEMLIELTNQKASKNNSIDLNAYAIGITEARNYILNYKKQSDGK